jgi:hypothetical protein
VGPPRCRAASGPSNLGVDSLVIGFYRGKDFIYAARVRAGLVSATRREVFDKIRPQLDKVSNELPADNRPSANWTLVTIASWHYPKLAMLRQYWNADSAKLVSSMLAQYAPAAQLNLVNS